MKTTRFLMAAMTVLFLASISQAVVTLTSGTSSNNTTDTWPFLYDGNKGEPSRIDLSPDKDCEAVFDLGGSAQVNGALITYYDAYAGGVYKPGAVEFYFSDIQDFFNPTPNSVFDTTTAWPAPVYGWEIRTDQLATTSGTARYLKIVLKDMVTWNEQPVNGNWMMVFEIDPLVEAAPNWPNYLPGDFNKDGEVGPEDFGILKDNFGLDSLPFGNHESWTIGDANDDGEIGPEDFGILKDNFGLDGGPTGTYPLANVPEPVTLVTLLAAAVPAILKRRAKV